MMFTEKLEFPVLYDSSGRIAREWEVFDLLNDGVAAPTTFVFDASGTLQFSQIGQNAGDRPTTDEVMDILRSAT